MLAGFRADSRERTVMTRHAVTREAGMVHRCRAPRGLRVAGITLRGGRQVRCRLASGQRSVMASIASCNRSLGMIETHDRRERGRCFVVACVARIRRDQSVQMLSALARCTGERTAVARHAVADKRGVIDGDGHPSGRDVARTALRRRRDMRGRILTGSQCSVMTLVACRQNRCLRMIKRQYLRPLRRVFAMTGMALVAGIESGVVFACLAAGVGAVMTTKAVVHERRVIHRGRNPARGRVTQTAIFGRRNMSWPLRGKPSVGVAHIATLRCCVCLRVIHDDVGTTPSRRPRAHALVAVLAQRGRVDVCNGFGRGANCRWRGVLVTQHAVINDTNYCVRECARNPRRARMADVARCVGWNMVRGLTCSVRNQHGRRCVAGMAGVATGFAHFIVVHGKCRTEARIAMATLASIGRAGVIYRFVISVAPGVAARTDYLSVIDGIRRPKRNEVMARVATVARIDVIWRFTARIASVMA